MVHRGVVLRAAHDKPKPSCFLHAAAHYGGMPSLEVEQVAWKKAFRWSVWGWPSVMSGALSVPSTIIAIWAPSWSKWAFVGVAIVGYLFVLIRLAYKCACLEDHILKPKLTVRCGTILDGCNKHHPERKVILLRLVVENISSGTIDECQGVLVKIERNGVPIWHGDNRNLAFAPEEKVDSESKTIRPGVEEYLDVVGIGDNRIDCIGTKGRHWPDFFPPIGELFGKGDVILTITLTGRNTAPLKGMFRLHVAQKYEESYLEEVKP